MLREQDDFKEWETLKYELDAFTLDEFDVVFEHFTKMKAIKTTLIECPEAVRYPEESIREAIQNASKSHELLYWYTSTSNTQKQTPANPPAKQTRNNSLQSKRRFACIV